MYSVEQIKDFSSAFATGMGLGIGVGFILSFIAFVICIFFVSLAFNVDIRPFSKRVKE